MNAELITARDMIASGDTPCKLYDWYHGLLPNGLPRGVLAEYIAGHLGVSTSRIERKPARDFADLKGLTLITAERTEVSCGSYSDGNDELRFTTDLGEIYALYHIRDCCESVTIEDICGDLDDLVGSEILLAEESIQERPDGCEEWQDASETWTFYKMATHKGAVTIRWFGSSNGYYSESVDFRRVKQ